MREQDSNNGFGSNQATNPDVAFLNYYNGSFYEAYRQGREAFYPIPDQSQDIYFFNRIAAELGANSILELGTGNGRIACYLASRGFNVSALDYSEAMLQEARKRCDVEWIKGDVRCFRLKKQFELIIYGFDGLSHIHDPKDIKAGLACIKRHLKDNGRFIVDVTHLNSDYFVNLAREHDRCRTIDAIFNDPAGRGTVVVTQTRCYEYADQLLKLRKYFRFSTTNEEISQELVFRIFFPKELEELLERNGFQVENKFGDYQGNEFTSQSRKLIIVCRKSKHNSSHNEFDLLK